MNFSLLLMLVTILIVIPLLISVIFIKPSTEEMPSTKIDKIKKNTLSDITDRTMNSSMLLPVPETVPVKDSNIIQKELFAEKMIYVTALQDHFFRGYSLLQGLQNAGFTYGKKGLFYYIEQENIVVCSAAPVIAPYVFDMTEIGALVTPALRLNINPAVDEQYAEQIIQRLAEELGGEVQDNAKYAHLYS